MSSGLQAALYYARKRRREVLGVLPGPPVGPAALSISNRLFRVIEGSPPGTILGTMQVIGGTGTYTFTKTADPSAKFTLAGGVLSTAGVWDAEAAESYGVTITADNGAGSQLARTFVFPIDGIPEPVLTGQRMERVSATSANLIASTDRPDGTMYAVVTLNATTPTAAQVKAGQNAAGAAAVKAVNQAVTAIGNQTLLASGLTAGVPYWAHFMHERLPSEQSAVASTPTSLTLT